MKQEPPSTSTRPYLIRALHEWCADNGFTPYVTVLVDGSVQVPMEFVKNGEIVLNIGFEATTSLRLGNDFMEFKARFGGVVRDIFVPIDRVVAIFSKENGQGMAFPRSDVTDTKLATLPETKTETPSAAHLVSVPIESSAPDTPDSTPPQKPSGRPTLTRVK
jgi:stringent starvation protein B